MRFWLLDTIEEFVADERLVGSKQVSYSEEYLQDHFPEFPVLPGVFMLEAATQASAWLLRLSEDYAHSVIELKEAKNIKYADFVRPGSRLTVTTELMKKDDREATFKVSGMVGDSTSLSGRLVLERFNLGDTDPSMAEVDAHVVRYMRSIEQVMRLNRVPVGNAT
ncbi:3-hydroxyacyl-ACP dehydratase FabZ family protein [Botrimarina mediterranea]|uniref:3-hydroxyacyl-[acyl-carrier-protein] dehydratase FabZ n=1 Tax=Botrimarina mediterranea TaxID=2528022 RepID=A0A518K2D8_9BACT|nr:3-hydroxyacyl-ACP dehydratase FabZ family protein [Botrimarina mediterranea]QDV71978.1 3-hydroxyacyl-[acyl-carrier-protein] dehydratase FabZ [Botrimarina mediterranea]QDV76519.1 3-hydroxyacyl-[acyl-carrier-protein] dehydratase FabZ [Planctomycetes bacterium K2D]